jgi:hypothetical protein
MKDRTITNSRKNLDALYRVNDVLIGLALEFNIVADGLDDSHDELLNELTHHVALKLGIVQPSHE